MTRNDFYKRTHKSVPVIFEPPCISLYTDESTIACMIFGLINKLYETKLN